jgi:hypothetical protein
MPGEAVFRHGVSVEGAADRRFDLRGSIVARWSHAAATLGARARAIIPDISLFPGGPDLAALGISEPPAGRAGSPRCGDHQ